MGLPHKAPVQSDKNANKAPVGAALTLGVRGGNVLVALLVLPLYIPALVFGAGAVQAQVSGLGATAHLSILAAMLVLAAFFSPWTCSAALRISLE